MGNEEIALLVDAIHRIRVIEDRYRENHSSEAAYAVLLCKWAVQDVLEETRWSKGYIG